jgi:hypothetical protein
MQRRQVGRIGDPVIQAFDVCGEVWAVLHKVTVVDVEALDAVRMVTWRATVGDCAA